MVMKNIETVMMDLKEKMKIIHIGCRLLMKL